MNGEAFAHSGWDLARLNGHPALGLMIGLEPGSECILSRSGLMSGSYRVTASLRPKPDRVD
jgi:hypothetical protein